MQKYFFAWIALVGAVLATFGSVLMVQGLNGRAEVASSIKAEKIYLGMAVNPKTKAVDEVVASVVPKKYQGKQVTDATTMRMMRDVILGHTLNATDGKRYAEMPRYVLDKNGNPVLDENGQPVLNHARDIWVTSVTWQSALNLGYLSWKLSEFVITLGAILAGLGVTIWGLGIPYAFKKR